MYDFLENLGDCDFCPDYIRTECKYNEEGCAQYDYLKEGIEDTTLEEVCDNLYNEEDNCIKCPFKMICNDNFLSFNKERDATTVLEEMKI